MHFLEELKSSEVDTWLVGFAIKTKLFHHGRKFFHYAPLKMSNC